MYFALLLTSIPSDVDHQHHDLHDLDSGLSSVVPITMQWADRPLVMGPFRIECFYILFAAMIHDRNPDMAYQIALYTKNARKQPLVDVMLLRHVLHMPGNLHSNRREREKLDELMERGSRADRRTQGLASRFLSKLKWWRGKDVSTVAVCTSV